MYAYAPNGKTIASSKETCPGWCAIAEGTFRRQADGSIVGENHDGTSFDYDAQVEFEINGQTIFLDEDGEEWPACAIVLVENELGSDDDEDEDGADAVLPPELVAEALARLKEWKAEIAAERRASRYVIEQPDTGFRRASSFTPEEKKALRPVAETIAMLDGNAFFGLQRGDDGDDVHYEQYLGEAHALVEANGAWSALTSMARQGQPLPDDIRIAGTVPIRMIGEDRIVDLVDSPSVILSLSGIEWDVTSEDDVEGPQGQTLTPLLPTELYVGVPSDWESEGLLVDLLSDRYGFLIKSMYSNQVVDDKGDPVL
jgi:hypothetical protein